MSWPLAPVAVAVDPGSDTTWAKGERAIAEPTAVAVDDQGRAHLFGSEAVMAAARRQSGLALIRPFTASEVIVPRLAGAYLQWLVARAGEGHCRLVPLMLVVPTTGLSPTADRWGMVAAGIGARPLLVERPLAAVAGLDLARDPARAVMVVVATGESTEVAVIADGKVVHSRHCDPMDQSIADIATVIRSALVSIDPDLELDVADAGIFLVGPRASARLAAELTARVAVEVSLAPNPERVVLEGARQAMETVRPFLPKLTGKFRAGLAGFGR